MACSLAGEGGSVAGHPMDENAPGGAFFLRLKKQPEISCIEQELPTQISEKKIDEKRNRKVLKKSERVVEKW